MKIYLPLLLMYIAFIGCDSRKTVVSQTNESPADLIRSKETEQLNKKQEEPGMLISTIEFELKATKEQIGEYEGDIIPWISIEDPQSEIAQLIDKDKIVIDHPEVILIIDYPLNKPAEFVLKNSGSGFSRKQLILEISKKYHEIYTEEERTAKTKTIPSDQREGLINRNETDGKYGVWGHDLGDLDLSAVEVYRLTNGQIKILLGIES